MATTQNPDRSSALTHYDKNEMRISREVVDYHIWLYGSIREATITKWITHTTVTQQIHGQAMRRKVHKWHQLFKASAEFVIEKWCMQRDV